MDDISQSQAHVSDAPNDINSPVATAVKATANSESPKKVVPPKKRIRKKPAAKKTVPAKSTANPRTKFAPRTFPAITLDTALQIATKIKDLNGGNAWDTAEVVKAVGYNSIKNTNFFYMAGASRDFGLTIGSRDTAKIEISELGRDIVYAPNPQAEHEKKLEAFLSVEIFKKVLEHYKGSALPEMKYLGNTLEKEFGLDPAVHEEFATLFRQNCQELDIDAGFDGNIAGNTKVQAAPATVVIGEQKGTPKTTLRAFVIMPFVERDEKYSKGFFSEVLRSLITPSAIDAGFSVETTNRQGSDVIQSTIINDLLDADLVIADLTGHNPNVLFELGV